MKNAFGPWTTSIDNTLELSRYWTRRLTMLSVVSSGKPATTGWQVLLLAVVGLAISVLPMLQPAVPAIAEGTADNSEMGKIVFYRDGRLASIRPDKGDLQWQSDGSRMDQIVVPFSMRLAPDGRRVAYGIHELSRDSLRSPIPQRNST